MGVDRQYCSALGKVGNGQLGVLLAYASVDTPLLTLAPVAAARWIIETEFQTAKGETRLDDHEVRSRRGRHHHITLALLAGAFLLTLQQDWVGNLPRITRRQITRLVRDLLPQPVLTLDDLPARLARTQACNDRAKQSHVKQRLRRQREPETHQLAA